MSSGDPFPPVCGGDTNDGAAASDCRDAHGVSRRHFLQAAGAAAGLAPAALPAQTPDPARAPTPSVPAARGANERAVRLRINGSARELFVEPRVTLLD
ncbi:MAG TPA: twin-arginine translocation signal domain-containing protein, partial [Caldimonas sp.]